MTLNYQGSLSEKKRHAASSFVRKLNQEVALLGSPCAVSGPEGQVVVLCSVRDKSAAKERSIRHIMSRVSQELLDSQGVWVVGVPQKERKTKQGALVTGARMQPAGR